MKITTQGHVDERERYNGESRKPDVDVGEKSRGGGGWPEIAVKSP